VKPNTHSYSANFYEAQQDGSMASAEIIAPLVLQLFPSQSMVDVGCGVGGWLRAFSQLGVSDYLGFDGDYVPREMLKIPSDRFRATDLAKLTSVGRRFDLACSLEVAEHLPASSARTLVGALVEAAPVVLFSAAIPDQGGQDHINEQWQSYWHALFVERGFVAIDCIRPAVFGDARVEWWYRQNVLVYCEPARCPPNWRPVSTPYELDRLDPGFLAQIPERYQPHSSRQAVASIRQSTTVLARSLGRRLGI
jgi:hypothetical protein